MRVLFLFLFFFPLVAFSQIKVTGKILRTDNSPIEFATVTILSLEDEILQGDFSDETGSFIIELSVEGLYKLKISYLQTTLFEKELRLKEDTDLGLIKSDNSILLDGVEITTSRQLEIKKEIGKYVVTNISASPLSKNKNSFELLGTIPFIDTSPDGNSIFIKNRKEAKILINGREVGDKEIALNILKATPAENIKKIEVITNPGSKYSASNQNGIINIQISKSEEGLKGSFSLGSTQAYYNSQNASAYFSYSKNSWFVSTGVSTNNYRFKLSQTAIYKDYINGQQTQMDQYSNTKNQSVTPFVNISYDLSPKQSIGVQFNSSFRNNEVQSNSENTYSSLLGNTADSLNLSNITNKSPSNRNIFFNANYNIKTDAIGSNLEMNAYSFSRKNNSNISNDFYWMDAKQSILQQPNISTDLYSFVADYTHNFENEDAIMLGSSYSHAKIKNDFFYGDYNGKEYVSDSLRTNDFKYQEDSFAAYIVYQKLLGDDWEAELGLRWENYDAKAVSDILSTSKRNNYLFPSVAIVFYADDANEFSLDYSSSIMRPSYSHYNPNVYFTSANSYKRSNPNLLPILSHSIAFNYSFLKHYSFDVEYDKAKNIFNDFDVVKPNGLIETITDNYGTGYELYFSFAYNKHFFKDRWNFSASAFYIYEKNKGIYNDVNLGFDNTEWGVRLKNYIYLNKKKDAILNLNYGYGSTNQSVLGNMNAMHSLTFEWSKSFNNFNLTLGAYDLLRPTLRLNEELKEYAFYKKIKYYKTVHFKLSYSFGNRKVKSVYDRQGKMSDRLE